MTQTLEREEIWENMISRNPPDEEFEVLGPAGEHRESDAHPTDWEAENLPIDDALMRDGYPLPIPSDRESYYGSHHFSYWVSGLRDMRDLLRCAERHALEVDTYLDIGCASGRVLRHFALNGRTSRVMGCDINRRHIEWILAHLPGNMEVFQNSSIPHLPLEDSSIDLVSAFSVFTHIENFDLAWIMEIKRILRPGGIAWITFHSKHMLNEMDESSWRFRSWRSHSEFAALQGNVPDDVKRLAFRWRNDRSYTSIVFYDREYLSNRWGRALRVLEVRMRASADQDVIVLRKS